MEKLFETRVPLICPEHHLMLREIVLDNLSLVVAFWGYL
jgi:hypothetical protein